MTTKVALVTGAARGIGAATTRALADRGWHVLAVDAGTDDPDLPYALGSAAELDATADGERIVAYRADVRDVVALHSAVTDAERRWGGLDVAVACAGVIAGGVPQWELDMASERAVLEVDLLGVLNLSRVAVPALLRRPVPRAGRFLAVASGAASRGLPMLAAYCAAKAGVTGLVRALAVELGDSGVTVNAVSPGSTATAMLEQTARLYGLPTTADFTAHQPVHRLLDPAEVAATLAFLAGPDASGITGAVVPVDGGMAL